MKVVIQGSLMALEHHGKSLDKVIHILINMELLAKMLITTEVKSDFIKEQFPN